MTMEIRIVVRLNGVTALVGGSCRTGYACTSVNHCVYCFSSRFPSSLPLRVIFFPPRFLYSPWKREQRGEPAQQKKKISGTSCQRCHRGRIKLRFGGREKTRSIGPRVFVYEPARIRETRSRGSRQSAADREFGGAPNKRAGGISFRFYRIAASYEIYMANFRLRTLVLIAIWFGFVAFFRTLD